MMETNYITLTKENIANEHICCAFQIRNARIVMNSKKNG